ncbi:hypothetical protein NYE70_25730 [Paenibacillus sp. FSL R5-0407]|uniref:hypothetical protein n=1 Tax=Paenibacillus sp. FSL R5-0407 TaxID=2975320 RepID=UPI0030FACAA8
MRKLFITLLMPAFILVILSGCGTSQNTSTTAAETNNSKEGNVDMLFDAPSFSRISSKELEEKMGKPEDVEEWKFNDKYDTKTYIYDSGNVEFMVIDDTVVRFSYYPVDQKIKDINDLFPMFGIQAGENIKKVADTGMAVKYHTVSDKIGEFYTLFDSSEEKTLSVIKVTYDLRYFE